MSAALSLTITTPMEVLVDHAQVRSVRAEDASGSFGLLPGHADFLTVLPASVLRWKEPDGTARFCAVGPGLLTVLGGTEVNVSCRKAILGADLEALEGEVEGLRHAETDADRRARVEQLRLHANAVRQMMRLLRPEQSGAFEHPPAPGPQGGQR